MQPTSSSCLVVVLALGACYGQSGSSEPSTLGEKALQPLAQEVCRVIDASSLAACSGITYFTRNNSYAWLGIELKRGVVKCTDLSTALSSIGWRYLGEKDNSRGEFLFARPGFELSCIGGEKVQKLSVFKPKP